MGGDEIENKKTFDYKLEFFENNLYQMSPVRGIDTPKDFVICRVPIVNAIRALKPYLTVSGNEMNRIPIVFTTTPLIRPAVETPGAPCPIQMGSMMRAKAAVGPET